MFPGPSPTSVTCSTVLQATEAGLGSGNEATSSTLVLRGHTPFRKRGKGSGNFCCSHLLHRNFIYLHYQTPSLSCGMGCGYVRLLPLVATVQSLSGDRGSVPGSASIVGLWGLGNQGMHRYLATLCL